MFNYLFDGSGALSGPVEFPVTPGIGIQLPANAVELTYELPEPEAGRSWALINGVPREVIDRRGVVYRKDGGAQQIWSELGELPDTLTAQPWPGEFHVWRDNAWVLDEQARLSSVRQQCLDKRDALLRDAVLRIAPLQYAEDIGDANHDEQLLLIEWKLYSVELNRIEQQVGFPVEISWPVVPGTTVNT
ncbi:tail fiber assembly protein [Pseudomonas sp. MG-9]|uniref:Tail fiber assembly protein n=1 Tax=Pseudomonas serboccidentalis TaxID=2964670 RepID=A0ABY7ZAR9_9PSED|nr:MULTISPECIES: tail fiber assembly protein [Pseudomonas]MBT9266037.1 tail fiber assembly protein [Pseudomonas sp. MG-9]WDR36595.1 tail fiber assembly protein [Pseudomonas serboccidentalis]